MDTLTSPFNMRIVNLVINFDLPKLPDDYVHRVGRTARAGKGTITNQHYLFES